MSAGSAGRVVRPMRTPILRNAASSSAPSSWRISVLEKGIVAELLSQARELLACQRQPILLAALSVDFVLGDERPSCLQLLQRHGLKGKAASSEKGVERRDGVGRVHGTT